MNQSKSILCQEVPVLILNIILGAGLLNLPSLLARTAGPDGLLALIATVGVNLIGVLLICLLVLRFPDQSIANYSPKLLGRFCGFLFNLTFAGYLLFAAAIVLREFSDTTNVLMLLRTPLEVIMLTMLLAASLLARNGLPPIARASQIIVLLLFFPLLITPLIWAIFDWGALLPVFQVGREAFLEAMTTSVFTLAGFELLLIISPYVLDKRRIIPASILSVLLAGTVAIVIVLVTFGTLTVDQVAKMNDSVFEVVKYMPVPVLILERVDLIFFSIWIAAAYSTVVILLYMVSQQLAETFTISSGKNFVWPLCVVIFFVARIPANQQDSKSFIQIVNYLWIALVYGAIPFLLVLSIIRNRSTAAKRTILGKSKRRKKTRN